MSVSRPTFFFFINWNSSPWKSATPASLHWRPRLKWRWPSKPHRQSVSTLTAWRLLCLRTSPDRKSSLPWGPAIHWTYVSSLSPWLQAPLLWFHFFEQCSTSLIPNNNASLCACLVCMCVCACMNACVLACMCVCVCVCVCVYDWRKGSGKWAGWNVWWFWFIALCLYACSVNLFTA